MAGTPIGALELAGGREFSVVLHDLLRERTDAIVNAANRELAHGGGVAAAIARAAGPELEAECARIIAERGRLETGAAVATSAGRLPFKGVIHVVGPRHGDGDEEATLARALGAAFELAEQRGWTSVAFPAVSSGIFAVPPEVCVRGYLRAVEGFAAAHPRSRLRTLRLVLMEGPLAQIMRARLG